MMEEKWTIYWSEHATDTYLYGTQLRFLDKHRVAFFNPLMPPGTVIKQWYSKTNYQLQKIEPTLPMIDGEGRYRITVNIDCNKDENCLIRLVFFDRYEEEAGSLIVRGKTMDFKCPLKTYSYKMQLISAGITQFCFHSVIIQELADEQK